MNCQKSSKEKICEKMEKEHFIEETCGHSTLLAVKDLTKDYEKDPQTPLDYMALLVHALMVETGFNKLETNVSNHRFKYGLQSHLSSATYCSLNVNKIGNVTTIIANFHGEPKSSIILTKTQTNQIVSSQG